MKKIFRSLITIALCAPLLGGCAFLDWLDDDGSNQNQNQTAEKTKLIGLELSEYSTEVEKGATYTYDGKITAKYEGGATAELNNEDVTFSTLSTATANVTRTLKVSYTDKYKENGTEKEVTEKAEAKIKVISTLKSISAKNKKVPLGGTRSLSVEYSPSDATYKDVTYSSNNESVASVDPNSGVITGHALGTAKITVTSAQYSSISTQVDISVEENVNDEWTILMYVCGADLESGIDEETSEQAGLASEDIKEIIGVSGQPEDVNILVQTGGCSSWKSGFPFTISSNKLERWRVENKSLVKEDSLTYASMGLSSTLSSFISWGLEYKPADKVGLIFWNHGGAMTGCCFDEKKSNDGLTPYEVSQAVKSAKSAAGYVENLEFIGYDCCLMQVQDIAGLNSEYANYQVASEESEWGYGWTYDEWIKDLYQKKSTTAILDSIVNSFRDETTSTYTQWQIKYPSEDIVNDQTLSYLNLSNWNSYKNAWEDMASTLSGIITSSSKWNTFGNLLNTCQRFGLTEVDYWGTTAYAYDVFDVKDFFTKIKNSSVYNSNETLMDKIDSCESALSNLIAYSWNGEGSPNAHGLTLFAPVSGYSSSSTYDSTATTLSTWRGICDSYGTWY